ncbi:cupin domain-containing protein [Streptomyces sp. NPDC050287]|uniref:cupin domain-containing protein n=1 Tax=Streptomyces sp. NPDC050287 TaxID=3365608 RepID=UPI003795A3C5
MARKYVMGNRADGLSDVLQDDEIAFKGPASNVDLWVNASTPADLTATDDPTVGKAFEHEPPDGGATFRIVSWAPGSFEYATPEQVHEYHTSIHSAHIPSIEYIRSAKHPSMHRTDTLNYFIVLSGQMWALTEGRDVLVKPGDVLIQHGCMHGWRVEGSEPCVMAAVLIDAEWPQ